MNKQLMLIILLLMGASLRAQQEYSESISRDAKEMAEAIENNEWQKIIDLTYPELIKMKGGEKQMMQQAEISDRQIRQQGFKVLKAELSDPLQTLEGEEFILTVIPIRLTFDGPKGKLYSESGLLGVSEDQGKSWKFIALSQVDINDVMQLFPLMSKKLMFPRKRVYQ